MASCNISAIIVRPIGDQSMTSVMKALVLGVLLLLHAANALNDSDLHPSAIALPDEIDQAPVLSRSDLLSYLLSRVLSKGFAYCGS